MCSPQVMAKVRTEVSRRRVLAMAGAGTLAAGGAILAPNRFAATAQDGTPVAAPPAAAATPGGGPGTAPLLSGTFTQLLDLTHTLTPEFPLFPGGVPMALVPDKTYADDGYYANRLELDEHSGTHLDAPAHFVEGAATADQLPVERFVAPLAVIDISDRAATDDDAQLTTDDVLAWEAAYGPLPAGAFVAMYSGWERRLDDPDTYVNLDADGVQHYPGIAPAAAEFLVAERDIAGVGVDTLSQDYGASTDFGTHVAILGAGKYGIENLANLGESPPSGAFILVGGPKHENASGGPTRAFALF